MVINFQGDMTVDKAGSVRDELLAALQQGEPVRVSCAGVQDADMSFFLVLLAADESFRREGVELSFAPDLAKELVPLAKAMGCHRLFEGGGAVEKAEINLSENGAQ
ncbi:STAS domain-containing protein [Oceanidesulfovibrio marinus]|nr:STAS domain-containing protein [Oceanidesulfovibrio marinus]